MKPHVWIPKPLVELVEGVTLLEWQIRWLRKHGARVLLFPTQQYCLL
jgi:NDP-sugar pyrophosphorylase family protein